MQSAALLVVRIGARVQQAIGDRRVDVLVPAPNLAESAVHRAACESGIEL